MTSRLRPAALAAAALATTAVVAVGSPAFAGKPTVANGVTVTATVSGGSATVTSVVGVPLASIASTECRIDGVATPCGTWTTTAKNTTYHSTVSGLGAGTHEYYQLVHRTDGSLTQGSGIITVR